MSAFGGKADVRELPAVCPLIATSGHLAVATRQRKAPHEAGLEEECYRNDIRSLSYLHSAGKMFADPLPEISAFGGKADVLAHPLECLLKAISGHSSILLPDIPSCRDSGGTSSGMAILTAST